MDILKKKSCVREEKRRGEEGEVAKRVHLSDPLLSNLVVIIGKVCD